MWKHSLCLFDFPSANYAKGYPLSAHIEYYLIPETRPVEEMIRDINGILSESSQTWQVKYFYKSISKFPKKSFLH